MEHTISVHLSNRAKAILTLSLLSPVFGELVSGSSPPLEFFNPLAFIFLWGLYGGGVLLMREFWIRCGKGYIRLMVLGISYGIIEEGLAIKSFFDPHWMDLGTYATYGRFAGVNFGWVFWLISFHAIYSITVPILIFTALYPEYRDRELLTDRERRTVYAIFLLTCTIIFFGLNPYSPPPLQYILTLVVLIMLIYVARLNIKPLLALRGFKKRPIMWSALLSSAIFVNFAIIPNTGLHPLIVCFFGTLLLISFYSSMVINKPEDEIGVAIGLLVPMLLFYDIILELHGVIGMSGVGIATFAFLFGKYREIKRKGATISVGR